MSPKHPHHSRKSGGRTIEAPGLLEEFRLRELSRRDLLRGALAASASMAGAWLLGCSDGRGPGGGGSDAGADGGGPPPDAGSDAGPPPPRHLTGMGYSETSWTEALDAALAETVGLSFIAPGDTVYFKVNSNSGDPYPMSTYPDLIVELARRCTDLGATRIIVGDRSFWGDTGTLANLRRNGISDAATTAGAELVVFDDAMVDWVTIPQTMAPNWAGGYRLPVPVMEATHIINLPCVKTHFIAHFTMSLKNALGLVNPVDRRRTGNLDVHQYPRLWNQIAQVNQGLTPSLNVLDGYRALITGGPTIRDGAGPTYADPKVYIVSTDRIAADVTGIGVLQTLSPASEEVTRRAAWASPQIAAAVAAGVGIDTPDLLDLSGPTVPMIADYLDRATRT